MIETSTFIGMLATLCSTSSFVPQAVRIIRTRDTQAISARMYIITVSGFSLWLCYGLLLAQWPLILTNGVCLLLSAFILTMKLAPPKYRDKIAMLVTRTRRRSAERR